MNASALRSLLAAALLALAGCATYDSTYYGRTSSYGDYYTSDDDGYYDDYYDGYGYSPYHSVLWPSYSRYYDPWYSPSWSWGYSYWSRPSWRSRVGISYGWGYDPWGYRSAWSPWRDPWYYDRWHGYQSPRYRRHGGNSDWRHAYRDGSGWRDRSAREEAERMARRDGLDRGYGSRSRDEGYGRYDERAPDGALGDSRRGFGVPRGSAREQLGRGAPVSQPETQPLGSTRESGWVGAMPERDIERRSWREREDERPVREEPQFQRYSGDFGGRREVNRYESERSRFESHGGGAPEPRSAPVYRSEPEPSRWSDSARETAPRFESLPSNDSGWRNESRGREVDFSREERGGGSSRPEPSFERHDSGGFSRERAEGSSRREVERFERPDEQAQ